MSVRLGCVTDALSVRAMQRIVGMIERKERERKRVGIQVFLNVSRKHSSIKVLPAYEENIDNDDYYYYYRGHSFIPECY